MPTVLEQTKYWKNILLMFMKEGKNPELFVQYVDAAFLKNIIWKYTLLKFMKEKRTIRLHVILVVTEVPDWWI